MTFLHPLLFAAGAAAISIPIIIHLLMHRRRKPVMWGAMRFLVEAYKRQRRRLMVEKWLLLATRCMLLLLIALALGRPLLDKLAALRASRSIIVLIDNGVASTARAPGEPAALDRHKAAAKAVLDALSSGVTDSADRVAVIALAGPAEAIVSPPSANLASIRTLIDAIEPADSRTDLPGALSIAAQLIGTPGAGDGAALTPPDRTVIVLLSDFLEGSADLSASGDALGGVRLPEGVRIIASEPMAQPLANTAIVGVQPLRSILLDAPGSSPAADASGDLVRVELARSGALVNQPQTVNVRLRLVSPRAPGATGGGAASASGTPSDEQRATVRFAPGQETGVAVLPVRVERSLGSSSRPSSSLTPDAPSNREAVLVARIDDDALVADNAYRRPVEVRDTLRVGVVAPIRFGRAERVDKLDAGSWARLALSPGPDSAANGIDAVTIEPANLDSSRLLSLDAVILPRPDLIPESSWSRLKLFAESGGLILVTPPPDLTVHVWGDAFARGLSLPFMPAREMLSVPGATLRRAGDASPDRANLLSLIDGELDDLLRAVTINTLLPLDPKPEAGTVLLQTDAGQPVLWVGQGSLGQGSLGQGGAASSSPAPQTPNPKPQTPYSPSRGTLIYLALPLDLDASDLPAKPLMVPLIQELIRQGIGQARGSFASTAGLRPLLPARTAELRPLPDPGREGDPRNADRSAQALTPGTSVPATRTAGLYRAVDDRGSARGIVAINTDARGTRLNPQTRENVAAALGRILSSPATADAAGPGALQFLPSSGAPTSIPEAIQAALGKAATPRSISLPLLIAALLLALAEVFLARRASHADADPTLSGADAPQRSAAA